MRDAIKAIKRLFSWFDVAHATDHEWDHSKTDQLKQQGTSKRRHHFEEDELSELYDAAVEYGSLRSYHSVSPTERDQLMEYLSQRFGKPNGEVSPDDFDPASSWKFPSLVSIGVDLGLRPIGIERASTNCLRPTDQKVVIPRDESSKGNNPRECVLSPRASRALQRWMRERRGHEKYADTDAIWLTKYGNSYQSASLNDLLNRFPSLTDIKPRNRDLTWYAIRRGAATMWAENSGSEQASEQLRHKQVETTMPYVNGNTESRKNVAADNR